MFSFNLRKGMFCVMAIIRVRLSENPFRAAFPLKVEIEQGPEEVMIFLDSTVIFIDFRTFTLSQYQTANQINNIALALAVRHLKTGRPAISFKFNPLSQVSSCCLPFSFTLFRFWAENFSQADKKIHIYAYIYFVF